MVMVTTSAAPSTSTASVTRSVCVPDTCACCGSLPPHCTVEENMLLKVTLKVLGVMRATEQPAGSVELDTVEFFTRAEPRILEAHAKQSP